jgi:tryptophan synthase beta chain
MRDWVTNVDDTHYLIGTVAGPHPFPEMVRDFQRVIGVEARAQVLELDRPAARRGRGLRRRRVQRDRHLPPRSSTTSVSARRLEAGGDGVETGRHAATITGGSRGGSCTVRARRAAGRRRADVESHSISPAWTTPASAPSTPGCRHRAGEYEPITDAEAMEAFRLLCRPRGSSRRSRPRTRSPARCGSAASSARRGRSW